MNLSCLWIWPVSDPAIGAAIIGAIATITSVAVSVWLAYRGVLLTIRDNRIRALDDKLTTLRREAYLEACDVAAESVQFVGSLPDEDITLASGASVLRRVDGVASKLHVLAGQGTLSVVMNYVNAFYDEYAAAVNFKYPYERNASELKTLNEHLERLENDTPPGLASSLRQTDRQLLREQIAKLSAENLDLFEKLLTHCSKVAERLTPLAVESTLALRKEFDLPIDEKWYRSQMTMNLQLGEARWEPILRNVREYVAKIRASQRTG